MRYLCLYVGTHVTVKHYLVEIFCKLPLYFIKIQQCFEQLNAPT